MNFFRNKYFLLGILLLVAIAIPVTIYVVQQQQDLQSRAAPTSNLSFTPSTQTVNVGDEFTVEVAVDPGQNFVSFVQFDVNYDPQFLEVIAIEPNITAFPLTLEGPNISAGSAQIAVGIGADVTQAIQTPTDVATIRVNALAATGSNPTQLTFVTGDTQVLSLSIDDQPGENVLSTATPASVTILAGSTTPTPSATPSASPTVSPSPSLSPTPSPTLPPNEAPGCTSFAVAPSTSGVAPFAVNFTAQGTDNGIITKATFNFGDGDVQDVVDGLNASTVSTQIAHTYQNQGSYTASVTFTDDQGAISQSCTQIIEVSVGGSGGTVDPSGSGSAATATPLPTKPPLSSPPGGIVETVAIAGGIILTIVGGILLFAL